MKPRPPIARASKKVIAANGGKIPFSSISPSGKGVKRKKRTKAERERIYGPPGYVEWIHEQPCAACRIVGHSVCAHLKTGGTGRKCDWTFTAPLCRSRGLEYSGDFHIGCHELYDEYRWIFEQDRPRFNAETAAAQTQAQWRESQV